MRFARIARIALIACALLGLPVAVAAQGTCQINGYNSTGCIAGGDAANAISVTVPTAARLTLGTTSVTIPAPTDVQFNNGFSAAASASYIIRANTAWALSVSGQTATWTATPVSARQTKPVGDLQWATASGGPYTDMTTTPTSFSSGSATASTPQSIWFRTKLGWTLDTPGSYQMSVTIAITAP